MKKAPFIILFLLFPLQHTFSVALVDSEKIVSLSPEEAKTKFYEQMVAINLESAHKLAKGKGTLVAIIDSGVDIQDTQLQSNSWVNPNEIPENGIDDDNNGYIDDINGWNFFDNDNIVRDATYHGTGSASVVASSQTGVAPEAEFIALRVSSPAGSTSKEKIFKAIEYAMNAGARIINLSFSMFKYESLNSEQLQILEELEKKEILLVMSAGNLGKECSHKIPMQLLPYKNIISVIATALNTTSPWIAGYSNFGSCYLIAAPSGVHTSESNYQFDWGILSAYGDDDKSYYLYNGTSAAAPVVAGTLALAMSAAPNMKGIEIKEILIKAAKKQTNLQGLVYTASLIDAFKTIVSVLEVENNDK